MTRRSSVRDAPLVAWGRALRRDRVRRRRLRLAAVAAVAIVPLGVTIAAPPGPRLVWNASASAPTGLYLVTSGARLARGDMVVAWVPEPWRGLAAARGYLPANVPLVKRVAAVPGDRVCARGRAVLVDGRRAAVRAMADPSGRTLPWWHGCVGLDADAVLLLSTDPRSFDGRYFGVSARSDIVGRARLLWRR